MTKSLIISRSKSAKSKSPRKKNVVRYCTTLIIQLSFMKTYYVWIVSHSECEANVFLKKYIPLGIYFYAVSVCGF